LNCSFINPEDARFCQNCGKPLEQPCPRCSTPNPAGARFCKNCGLNLVAPTAAATPAPINLVQKAQSTHISGDRRVVTVLFADVVNSTALAEAMDPEDWTLVMNRAFTHLIPVIYRYEGTIARLMGDALLAFFGAPVAHEDDPIRAGYAALDLISASQTFACEVKDQYGIDFAIRVGMNTGAVVVGEVGNNLAYEYTAMGDSINLAARLQMAAEPMSILCGEATYRLIAPIFECHDLGKIQVKGKSEPVQVYKLSGLKSVPEKRRGLAGIESPMIGRSEELANLLKLGRAVQAGLGRAVVIIGEPGIGKSRLVSEWKKEFSKQGEISSSGGKWIEANSLSYGQGLPYHLFIRLLRSILGFSTETENSEIQPRLKEITTEYFGTGSSNPYPYLSHLLSLPLEGTDDERVKMLDPQALQAQYMAAFVMLLKASAARNPLIIVLDDIQWADSSSIDLLSQLVPLCLEAPILFCFLIRIERDSPGWKLVAKVREQLGASLAEINLLSLSESESRLLISHLIKSDTLPDQFRDLILTKTEGNPLFLEEVVRMLIDRGILIRQGEGWEVSQEVESLDIPDNLQSLLLARIDRLPDDLKQTLKVASVLGRQFSVKVLQQVLEKRVVEISYLPE
jgi:class 3 adenylate cyclase